jgi:hypothetical protein
MPQSSAVANPGRGSAAAAAAPSPLASDGSPDNPGAAAALGGDDDKNDENDGADVPLYEESYHPPFLAALALFPPALPLFWCVYRFGCCLLLEDERRRGEGDLLSFSSTRCWSPTYRFPSFCLSLLPACPFFLASLTAPGAAQPPPALSFFTRKTSSPPPKAVPRPRHA